MQEKIDGLERSIDQLQTKMAVISTHVEYLRQAEEARSKRIWAIAMTGIGALIASFVGWLAAGGMNVK